jgi:hypothetical protein
MKTLMICISVCMLMGCAGNFSQHHPVDAARPIHLEDWAGTKQPRYSLMR